MAEAGKTRNSTDKRRRILEGALRAFAKKGFYNTKVSEIASEAGVADGTIYLYFKNKDDLLISLFEDRMEWVIERLNAELAQHEGSPVDKIRQFVHLHFLLVVEDRELAEFITVELRQSAKFVKEYKNAKFSDYLRILQTLIEDGQAAGQLNQDIDSRLASRVMFGALDEVLLSMALAKTPPERIKAQAQRIADMFLFGLGQTQE